MIYKTLISYEVLNDLKVVQIKESIIEIVDNEVVRNEKSHRRCIAPGEDYTSEYQEIKDICDLFHTPQAISDYLAHMEEQNV